MKKAFYFYKSVRIYLSVNKKITFIGGAENGISGEISQMVVCYFVSALEDEPLYSPTEQMCL